MKKSDLIGRGIANVMFGETGPDQTGETTTGKDATKEPKQRKKNEQPAQGETETTPEKEEIRATFIVETALLNRLKEIAYIERLKYKDVLKAALTEYIQRYDRKK